MPVYIYRDMQIKVLFNILHFPYPSNQPYSKNIINGDNFQHLNSIQSIIHLSYNTNRANNPIKQKEKFA